MLFFILTSDTSLAVISDVAILDTLITSKELFCSWNISVCDDDSALLHECNSFS